MSLIAITRDVSPSINDCELTFHGRQQIDVKRAIEQHHAYQDCLAELGARIISLRAEPNLPDAVFVEDTAVILEGIAVIANMGTRSRRPEAESIAEVLGRYRSLRFLNEPATLDGGDVLPVVPKVFVGLSRRTNRRRHRAIAENSWPAWLRSAGSRSDGLPASEKRLLLSWQEHHAPESIRGSIRPGCADSNCSMSRKTSPPRRTFFISMMS